MIVVVVYEVHHHGSAPLPTTVACAAPGAPRDPRVADASAPHGIFAFGAGKKTSAEAALVARYLLPNPDICGATLTFQWNQIDNGPGAPTRYNWSVIDDAIAPWTGAGKIVNLLFSGTDEGASTQPGGTPQYVLQQVKLVTCARARPTPVVWAPGYEDNWQTFIAAVVQHFDNDPDVGYIRFGLGTAAEGVFWPTLIVQRPCASLWDAAGYLTDWPVYVQQMIGFLGSLHSGRQLVIGLNVGTNLPPITQEAQEAAARGIGFGEESLAGPEAADILSGRPCDQFNWCQLNTQYAGRVPLYVQSLYATSPNSAKPGEGPLPPLLEAALKVHVQIFEVYTSDLLLAFDPSFHNYAQYHESYVAAIAATARVVGTHDGLAPVT